MRDVTAGFGFFSLGVLFMAKGFQQGDNLAMATGAGLMTTGLTLACLSLVGYAFCLFQDMNVTVEVEVESQEVTT